MPPFTIGGYDTNPVFQSVCSRFIGFACLEGRSYVPICEIYPFGFRCVPAYDRVVVCIHIYTFLFHISSPCFSREAHAACGWEDVTIYFYAFSLNNESCQLLSCLPAFRSCGLLQDVRIFFSLV